MVAPKLVMPASTAPQSLSATDIGFQLAAGVCEGRKEISIALNREQVTLKLDEPTTLESLAAFGKLLGMYFAQKKDLRKFRSTSSALASLRWIGGLLQFFFHQAHRSMYRRILAQDSTGDSEDQVAATLASFQDGLASIDTQIAEQQVLALAKRLSAQIATEQTRAPRRISGHFPSKKSQQ